MNDSVPNGLAGASLHDQPAHGSDVVCTAMCFEYTQLAWLCIACIVRSIMELLAAYDKAKEKTAAAAAAAATDNASPEWTIAAQGTQAGPSAPGEQAAASDSNGSNSVSDPVASSNAAKACSSGSAGGSPEASTSSTTEQACKSMVDLSSKVEVAPVVIPPGMPLTFIYHIMQEQGLNYVPVIRHHGPLEGMVTRLGSCKVVVNCAQR